MASDQKICVGMIAGAHGVRGLVKLRSFTEDPEAILSYGTLTDERGVRTFKIELKSTANDYYIAALEGVASKEDADALRSTKLYAERSKLPKAGKREYYNADLMGLEAFDVEGKTYGKVMGAFDFGGGPFLEIGLTKKDSFMLPFNDSYVPQIDLKTGQITVVIPLGWLKAEEPEKDEEVRKEKAKKKSKDRGGKK